jgi:hypothetical protein
MSVDLWKQFQNWDAGWLNAFQLDPSHKSQAVEQNFKLPVLGQENVPDKYLLEAAELNLYEVPVLKIQKRVVPVELSVNL